MAGLADQPMMRDIPQQNQEAYDPINKWVDSLDENKQGNLNPAVKEHAGYVVPILKAAESGALGRTQAEKLARLNPHLVPSLYQAMLAGQKSNARNGVMRQHFDPGAQEQNVVTGGEDDQMVRYQPGRAPKADFHSAITALNSMNETASASELSEQYKRMKEPSDGGGGKFNSLDAAYAAIGVKDPRSATEKQHKEALRLFQPPVVQTVAGPGGTEQSKVTPRIDATGTTTPTGRNIFDDDLMKLSKSYKEANMSEIDTFVDSLDSKFVKYKDKGIPGLGNLKNISFTNFVKTAEGREIFADAQGVMAAVLRAGAGLSQTQGEADRLNQKMAKSAFNSAEDFLKQFEKLKTQYDKERGSLVAGFRPEVIDMWQERNPAGTDLRTSPWKKRSNAAASQPKAFTPEEIRAEIARRRSAGRL